MSDRDLVDAIITNNDEDAAFCLFHYKLINYFKKMSGTYSKLRYSDEDIASEMLIHLAENNWERLRSFKFKSSLFSWITVVTNRYLLNKILKISPYLKDEVLFTSLIEYGEEGEYDHMENLPDPEQILKEEARDDEESIKEILREIELLNPYMKEVIRLRCIMKLSSKKTAEILSKSGKNITPRAIDQVLKRALDIIRKKLLGERE
jgi:RNA polymerase sigma factor (sigma-70 family)